MTELTSAFAGLADLVGLGACDRIELRPALLRVLTDLYLQRLAHTSEDERCYCELALRLIDATDRPARAALANRLASYPFAPRAVIARLARDEIEVAAPLLEHSSCLTGAELEAIAKEQGGAHADIIATRRSAMLQPLPVSRPRHPIASELSDIFYAAGAAERRLILVNLEYAPIPPLRPSAFIRGADSWQLETAVFRHNSDAVVCALERMLGISRTQARRVISDELGEPIVTAAKAMDLPADVVQRLLLFMNPRIGQSVDRVCQLADLYCEISVTAARRMAAIWHEADRERPADGERSAEYYEAIPRRPPPDTARQAWPEVSRRSAHSQSMWLRFHATT